MKYVPWLLMLAMLFASLKFVVMDNDTVTALLEENNKLRGMLYEKMYKSVLGVKLTKCQTDLTATRGSCLECLSKKSKK